jgi:CubicO group peptidase (beta-lactamase class C family)
MKDTSYLVPTDKQSRLVNLFQRGADGTLTELPRELPAPATFFNGEGGLYSTAGDYLRFVQMLLNGGTLDGARILAPETVALMSRNHIGPLNLRIMKTTQPQLSCDFTFIDEEHDKWGLSFQITGRHIAGKRSTGSLSWAGLDNTYFWIDPSRGVTGVIMMQFAPFADPKALAVYDTFERGVYRMIPK